MGKRKTKADQRKKGISLPELPTEMLLSILKFLPIEDLVRNVSLVSKQFHVLSKDPSLKNSFRVRIGRKVPTSGDVQSVPNLTEDLLLVDDDKDDDDYGDGDDEDEDDDDEDDNEDNDDDDR